MIQKIFNREIELKKKEDKIALSNYSEYIPMYDIYSDMIYPINSLKIYYRLVTCHYRFITDEVKQWIENKMNKEGLSDEKKQYYSDILKIINNYDLEHLEKTSYNTLYRYSPDFGLSISICKRNSFHPYATHLTPYYTKNELIKLGMNNMIINKVEPANLVDKQLHYEICKKVSKNDISFETISDHMKQIINNNCINWTVFYSMTGSYIFNNILRSHQKMNQYMYDGLLKIVDTVNKVQLPKEYYFYRFVWDDKYLQKLKIGEVFVDEGFISTTRDPFYSPGIKMDFGLILIRINIPEHMKGVGLLIENFSRFPKEEEFLIQPFTKLKLKARNEKATYYHTNDKFEKLIKKRYEFDLVGTNKLSKIKVEPNENIPEIDINMEFNSLDRIGIFKGFLNKCDEYGQFRIKDKIFLAQWFDSTGSYNNMYKNKTKDGFIITQYFEGYPLLSIEMGDNLYVNYLRTICSYDSSIEKYKEENNDEVIALFSKMFKYKIANICFDYANFGSFTDNYTDNKEYLYTRLYCKTIYDYYKYNKNITTKFYKFDYGFWKLDKIGKTKVDQLILNKLPKELKDKKFTWKELFIIIIEQYFYLYNRLEEWVNDAFENLFNNAFFTFNCVSYLEKLGYKIIDMPDFKHISLYDRGDLFRTVFHDNIRRY